MKTRLILIAIAGIILLLICSLIAFYQTVIKKDLSEIAGAFWCIGLGTAFGLIMSYLLISTAKDFKS